MRKDLMKKLLFVLFLACCLLNGCGTENNKPAAGAGGGYYADFMAVDAAADGVDISSAGFDEALEEINENLANMSQQLGGITFSGEPNADSVGMRNFVKKLNAGEAELFLRTDLAQEYALPIMAALWDFSGDVQLVYVQPDGVDKVLWSSEGQEEWLINLEINLLPGGGRLEWRSENGCECTMYFLIERSEEAGVIGFRA